MNTISEEKRMSCYYFIDDDLCVNEASMHQAFRITHKHGETYKAWLREQMKQGNITKIVPESDVDLCELALKNRVAAVREYREKTGCTLRESRDHIEKLIDDLEAGKAKQPEKAVETDASKTPQLDTIMTVSSAHVRPETMERLIANDFDWLPSYRIPNPCCDSMSYGVLIAAGDEDDMSLDDIPDDLQDILRLAKTYNAWFVRIDADDPECSALRDFSSEWGWNEDKYVEPPEY